MQTRTLGLYWEVGPDPLSKTNKCLDTSARSWAENHECHQQPVEAFRVRIRCQLQAPLQGCPSQRSSPTCFVWAAKNCLLLLAKWPMPHPHRDRKGLLGVDRDDAVWDPHCLSAVELEDLVAVMAVVRGKADGPVPGASWGRQQLSRARRSTWSNTVMLTVHCVMNSHGISSSSPTRYSLYFKITIET